MFLEVLDEFNLLKIKVIKRISGEKKNFIIDR